MIRQSRQGTHQTPGRPRPAVGVVHSILSVVTVQNGVSVLRVIVIPRRQPDLNLARQQDHIAQDIDVGQVDVDAKRIFGRNFEDPTATGAIGKWRLQFALGFLRYANALGGGRQFGAGGSDGL